MSEYSEPFTLTIADDENPTVQVTSPSGGERYPISQPGVPRTETITWEMNDNIRTCQVDIALLHSNDAGETWQETPAGGGLPATLGTQTRCKYPGETRTSLTYTVPETPPSGTVGSLYKIRVRVTDQAGKVGEDVSDAPFHVVQPTPDVRTLILANLSRMTSTAGLRTELNNLAAHSRVQGEVIDLDAVTTLNALYDAWDNGTATANDVLFAEGGLHDHVLSLLNSYPGVEHLIIVGDDTVVPMARLTDRTVAYPEDRYTDVDPATTVGASLAANQYLSDDALTIRSTLRPTDLDDNVLLPEMNVGRLVETPPEIIRAVATFLSQNGILDLTARSDKVAVTAYDFLKDSGRRIEKRWSTTLDAAAVDGDLIGQNWGEDDLRGKLLTAFGIFSLNGHATHHAEGIPGTEPFGDQGLPASEIYGQDACFTPTSGAVDMPGAIVYAVGCHGGLSVAGSCVAVLSMATGPEEDAWAATAVVEIFNAHLRAGETFRVIDGDHTALVRPPDGWAETLADEELTRLTEALRVDHLLIAETTPFEGGLRARISLYDPAEGRHVETVTASGSAEELPGALANAAAWLRQEGLGAPPVLAHELAAARAAFPNGDAGRLYAQGLAALRRYDPRTARDYLTQATAAAPEHPMPWAALARIHVQLGDLEDGFEAGEKAADFAGALPSGVRLRIHADAARNAQDWQEVARLYRLAWRSHPDVFTAAHALAEALLAAGDVAAAREVVDVLPSISLTRVDDGYAALTMAATAFLLGDYPAARLSATTAAEIGKATGARQLYAEARLLETIALDLGGQAAAARASFAEARKGFERAANRNGLVDALGDYAVVLANQGKVTEAATQFETLREIYREDGDRFHEAMMANDLGTAFIDAGEFDQAVVLLEEAAAIFDDLELKADAAGVILNLGTEEQLRGRLESARRRYEQAHDVFEAAGDRELRAYALTNLGEIAYWNGNLDLALKRHRQARTINQEIGVPSGVAYDTFRIAEVLRRQGLSDDALRHYEQALAIQESLGESGAAGETRIGLARLEIARQNFGAAVEHARRATTALRDAEMTDLAVLAQIAEAEALLAHSPADVDGTREILVTAQLHAGVSEDRRVQLLARLLAARLALAVDMAGQSVAGELEVLAAEASADGFVLVAEDVHRLLGTSSR